MPVRMVARVAMVAMRTTRMEGLPSFCTSLLMPAEPMAAEMRQDPAKMPANCSTTMTR